MPAQASATFREFLDQVRGYARRGFPVAEVLGYLRSQVMAPEELEPYLHWVPGRYTRNLVHRCADFELLILCWDPGQCAPVHGHEGELCWARVERGCLRFRNYAELERKGDQVRLAQTGPPVDGVCGHVDGPADIHSVENLAGGGGAVSLHLYARPFDHCEIYDLEQGLVCRKCLAYDSIEGRPCDPLSPRSADPAA